MSKVIVNAGVCGFRTEIEVNKVDGGNNSVTLRSQCPNFKGMDQELKELDPLKECFAKIGESQVYNVARKYCKHPGCLVPSGIIKAIEVENQFALPKSAEIIIEKD